MDLPEAHRRALHETGHVIARIGGPQWALPTPCDEWDVRFLVGHVVSGNLWVRPLVEGRTIEEVGDALDGDVLGDDPLESYEASAVEADEAFSSPGAMEAPCAVSYGPVPGSVYCGHRLLDVLVHGWDLSVATGQGTGMDEELAEVALALIEPQLEGLQASGAFGTPVMVADDAPASARLLGALGRSLP